MVSTATTKQKLREKQSQYLRSCIKWAGFAEPSDLVKRVVSVLLVMRQEMNLGQEAEKAVQA